MPKTAVLIIIPEFKNELDVLNWDKNINWAYSNYDKYPLENNNVSTEQRWALGFIVWNKLIEYFNMINSVNVFFIRTDYRLTTPYQIENNIISVKFDNKYGHIIYKTIISLRALKNKFDYYVRGNVNTIIDINYLDKFVNTLPKKNVFTSPFWQGNSYPFGYFMLITNDIANYISEINLQKRWFTEDTADDYELTEVILKKYTHYTIPGCDNPYGKINDINRCGINFELHGSKKKTSKTIIDAIKNTSDLVFLYRIKDVADNKYFEVYKFLIKHLWDKVVKNMFKNMVIYNETNNKIPHLEYERDEQLLVAKYINSNDIVLELGARYGSVSCIINRILDNKLNQVSVEPDNTVWKALEKNKISNNCSFNIFKGIVSNKNYELKLNGYGSTVDINNSITNMASIRTQNISLEDLQNKFGIKFNVLVADCEGFLETFLNENPVLYTQLHKIIFECDRADICDYNKIKLNLIENNFKLIENNFQCVYIK
jgi:FkbM family methyltransferase